MSNSEDRPSHSETLPSQVTPALLLERDKGLHKDVVAALVDGELFDLHTPVPEGVDKVEPLRASDPRALPIIRHSSAHVMADAVQRLYPGTKVTFGPAIEGGFYYDFDRPAGPFSDEELRAIESVMEEIVSKDLPFRRAVVSRDEARRILTELGETYKLEHLDRIEEPISVYRHGDWVDLCSGPHVPSTRFLKAFRLTSVAGAYWRGDERNPMLQRIYGTAFSTDKELRAHLRALEEAAKRDHRRLGKELELFAFHPLAPASPFFLPRGTVVYNQLVAYMRGLYLRHGYAEVITPQVYDNELFRTSGHLPGYGTNMFFAVTQEELTELKAGGREGEAHSTRFGVKPMNCPGHALLFGMDLKSYRDLPLRMADFGRLHRYERSGVVQGLTRVRTFAQDDGHVFCTLDQVQGEIRAFLSLVDDVYRDFGFDDVTVVIATRPDDRIGDDDVWDRSEEALKRATESAGLDYKVAEGEGAFYGPKIEFHLKDAIGRRWQLGTMQADFILPERFDLEYVGEDNNRHRPVMLHRAVFGSVERFFGILVEHLAGAFPTWLAPEQVRLVTVSEKVDPYALEAAELLRRHGLRVGTDLGPQKLGAKIRRARLFRTPHIAVVGHQEAEDRTLSVKVRGDGGEQLDWGPLPIDEVRSRLAAESLAPSLRVH